MSKVVIIGSGYVGTTTAALLSVAGHSVVAIDIDERKVEQINNGKAPFFETGLDKLIAHSIQEGTLSASASYDSVKEAEFIFSSVGTPDKPDGSPNLTYIDSVANTVAENAPSGAIFIQKSTVPVETGTRLKQVVSNQTYVSNPEFLREGTAIQDSILSDRIVVGCDDAEAAQKIVALFNTVNESAQKINKLSGININADRVDNNTPETIVTSVNSAELIKVTANAFLALKISFANSVAKLADKSNADIVEVMHGIGTDKRIGKAFLNAGIGYGGGCFPKDVSGLISVAIDHGVDFGIMTSAVDINASMPGYTVNKAHEKQDLKGKTVAVLGLAFKPGTSDSRKSPSVLVANMLQKLGAKVIAYDPEAMEEAKEDLHKDVQLVDSTNEATDGAFAVFIATEWPEFKNLDMADLKTRMSGTMIVDCKNSLNVSDVTASGLEYVGVGR